MYEFFHINPRSTTLAGWVFEAIVHRLFSDSWQSGPAPQPIRTASNGCVPPVFSTDLPPSMPDTSLSSFVRLRAGTRTVTRVNFADRQLRDVTLDSDKYYMPTAATHPLFDSFTIDLDSQTGLTSIFLIMISPMHEGSTEGYPYVRRIMRRVREVLEKTDSNATVKVAYSSTSGRYLSAGTSTPKRTIIGGTASVYAFPSWDIMVRRPDGEIHVP
jgi:hypothetical protein